MKKTIKIEGMMCMHCVARVEKALASIPGVSKVTVNLKKKNAVIEFTDLISDEAIKTVITDAGYEVLGIE